MDHSRTCWSFRLKVLDLLGVVVPGISSRRSTWSDLVGKAVQSEKDKEGLDRLDKLNVARLLAGFGALNGLTSYSALLSDFPLGMRATSRAPAHGQSTSCPRLFPAKEGEHN